MTDLTLDALVEDVARAISGAPFATAKSRQKARAALAAVAKAAGGAYVLHGSAAAVQWTVYNQGDQRGCPKLRVAALLHVLAEAASHD
jgi:hypothetical protein